MHSLFLGTIKSLFVYWFDTSSKPYSLKSKINQIDRRLLRIRPPSYIKNAPRSVKDFRIWKSSEFLIFIMYYALIVFNGTMDPEYFTHFTSLIIAIEILFSRTIDATCLDSVQIILQEFVKNSAELYDDLFLKSGTHELLHLCESARQFGPPNFYSCFQFDELNRKFIRGIKGKSLIGDDFIKNFSICLNLSRLPV